MTTIIGKPFRTYPDGISMKSSYKKVGVGYRKWHAVCECGCGKIFVSRLRTLKTKTVCDATCKECSHKSSKNPTWVEKLRERMIRHQNWYRDRRGPKLCKDCDKPRVFQAGECNEQLCRECLATKFHKEPRVEVTKSSVFAETVVRYVSDDPSPSFENAVRLLEDGY